MSTKTERLMSLRAARQLRRVRDFYSAGVLLWAAAAGWTGWTHPGSRQMWVSLLLLGVFAGLLATASVWLRRIQTAPGHKPAHHAAPGRARTLRTSFGHARTPRTAFGHARTHHAAP
ncbi:hypothetical protein [Streptomyces sp. NPDC088707]|uniref:hypothetical protein n=1 Tax=Streptomyces sp. NPDC088707 TaxID=3365871 RepID=UPI0037FFD617